MIQNEDHNQHIIHGSNLWADHRPDQNNDPKARIKAEWPAAICPGIVKGIKDQCFNGKKAYDELEREGFTVTIHGKGSYVTAANTELMMEEQKKEVEQDLEQAILKGRRFGISDEDIKTLFELILEG